MVVQLMKYGADPSLIDGEGCSCVHLAAQFGHTSIVAYLIAKGQVDETKATCFFRKMLKVTGQPYVFPYYYSPGLLLKKEKASSCIGIVSHTCCASDLHQGELCCFSSTASLFR